MKALKTLGWSLVCFVALTAGIAADEPLTAAPEVRIEHATGLGSGVHIGDQRVLTAAHVALHMANKPGTVIDENGNRARAYVIWTDEANDIAMLRILDSLPVRAALYSCVDPTIGTEIETVGNPMGIPFVHTWGRVASKRTDLSAKGGAESYIAIDLTFASGNSGGPVYDESGVVVGLISGSLADEAYRVVSFMVPTAVACDRLDTPAA